MSSGVQAQVNVPADTKTTVYTVPTDYIGVYKITARNTSDEAKATIQVWYTKTTTSDEKKEWEEQFERSFSISGEVLDEGQKIIIETSEACIVTVKGIEEAV
jgi:hypothetical protein